MFVCLLGVFSSHSRMFHLYVYGDVTIAGEGLQLLTYGSLVCNTYCDTGRPFIMVFPEDS